MVREYNLMKKTFMVKDTFPRRDIYGIISMLPNQNISIWMAPLPTETPVTYQHITTPSLVFSHQPWHHPPKKKHRSHPLPPLLFSFQANKKDY